jgi:hypothetical protein
MDMTVTTPMHVPAPFGEAAKAKHDRIMLELEKLKAAEALEAKETEERKRLLTEGSDEEVDACENRTDAARSEQVRILERVDLLIGQLVEANAKARQSRLDDLRARAESAREIGERLLKVDYAKAAKSLGSTLSKLHAISVFIETANRFLQRRGVEQPVPSPNVIRCRPRVITEVQVMRTVDYLDPRHPAHGNVYFAHDGRPYVNGTNERATPVEIEVTERHDTDPYFPDPVEEAAFVPGLEPHTDFWDADDRISAEKQLAVLADLGINPELPELE